MDGKYDAGPLTFSSPGMFASCKRSNHPSILRQLDPDVLALAVGLSGQATE
jgi:hypothetical protein